jgi:hypothetical protein
MRCFLLAICLFLLAPAWTGASSLKIAYIKQGYLYTLAIDRAGRPIRGAHPLLIRPVPANSALSLVGSPDGRYVAVGVFTSVQIISLASHKIVRWPDPASDPSFSPDGRKLAFDDSGSDHPELRILDIATGHSRIFCKNAEEPFWSANGKEIVASLWPTATKPGRILVLNSQTSRVIFRSGPFSVDPTMPMLSPNGRYCSFRPELSRPIQVTSTNFYDLHDSNRPGPTCSAKGYAPVILESWSPNGRWMLWQWLVADPKNDGGFLYQDVGLTSFDGRVKHRIGRGENACFSPDSRHVFWLEPARKEDWHKPSYALMWKPFKGRARRLVAGVDAYAIVGAYSASRWQ